MCDANFVAESSESFRAADREQFYVSASRFKESLVIYTDDKCELLNAVRKSSQRPAALDLVTKKVAESINEMPVKKSLQQVAAENAEKDIPEIQERVRLRMRNLHQSQSRGIGI